MKKEGICLNCRKKNLSKGKGALCINCRKKLVKKVIKKKRLIGKTKAGYLYEIVNGRKVLIHQQIGKEKYGEIPKGFHIHHIDKDKTNNKRGNLILLHRKDHYRLHKWKAIKIKQKDKK